MRNKIKPIGIYPFYDEYRTSSSFRRFLYQFLPIPLHTYFPLRQELYLWLIRLWGYVVRWQYHNRKNLLVNIGAGNLGKPGWINTDMIQLTEINCLYDCRKKLPFADEVVKGIFCEHFFEHLDYTEEVPYFLSECKRVLKAGGILRIIVPDAERYLKAYAANDWEGLKTLRQLNEENIDPDYLFAYRTPMELVNMVFRQGYRHKFAYDFETLRFVLLRYGFADVKKQAFGQTMMEELNIDNPKRRAESMYVEAVKYRKIDPPS